MSASNSAMVVLVHGAWHGAWCWAALQAELDSRGIASLAVDLPGHGASIAPLGDLYGDAEHVANVIDGLAGPVVLVGHSYGGAVITQASANTVNAGNTGNTGNTGNAGNAGDVIHLIYLTAFVPDVGESLWGLVGAMPAAATTLATAMSIDGDIINIDPSLAHASFYNHCDPVSTPAYVARLCPQPMSTFTQAVTGAGWSSIPSTYVRCTDDEAIPISHQDLMAVRCTRVESLATDHSPFASMPVETAEIIAGVTGDASPGRSR